MTRKQGHKSAPPALAGLGAAAFVATALAAAPATIAAGFIDFERQRIAYHNIQGTIWRGSIERVSAAGIPLGDMEYRLSALSLLRLAPQITLSAQEGAVLGRGRFSLSAGGRVTVSDLNARIDLNASAPRGVLGQPAQGVAEIAIDRFDFSLKKGCQAAEGTIWTDVLNAPSKRYDLPALPLSGGVRCEGSAVVITMAGANERSSAEMSVRVLPNLTYEVTAEARASEPGIASALRLYGFEDDDGALTYGAAGVFKGAGS